MTSVKAENIRVCIERESNGRGSVDQSKVYPQLGYIKKPC
jgi:hypothetical protein